jgi:hypothetical protein
MKKRWVSRSWGWTPIVAGTGHTRMRVGVPFARPGKGFGVCDEVGLVLARVAADGVCLLQELGIKACIWGESPLD